MGGRELGMRGEAAAREYLERVGMTVADVNWRCPAGEVDIIAWEAETLVLCEVKTRRSLMTGIPEEAVSASKQKRICRLASAYMKSKGISPASVRFDVVSITVIAPDRALLRHHRGAFSAG